MGHDPMHRQPSTDASEAGRQRASHRHARHGTRHGRSPKRGRESSPRPPAKSQQPASTTRPPKPPPSKPLQEAIKKPTTPTPQAAIQNMPTTIPKDRSRARGRDTGLPRAHRGPRAPRNSRSASHTVNSPLRIWRAAPTPTAPHSNRSPGAAHALYRLPQGPGTERALRRHAQSTRARTDGPHMA